MGPEPSGPSATPPEPPHSDPSPLSRAHPPVVRLALVFYGLLWLAAVIWAALDGRSLVWLPTTGTGSVGRAVGAGVLAAASVVLVSQQLTQRTRVGEQLARSLAAVLGPLTLAECWLLALVSGIAEEAFFRGALQPQLGLVAASLLFGAAHFIPRRELFAWTPFAIAAGCLLGWLYDATGSLLAPVVAHAGINGVNLRRLTQRR